MANRWKINFVMARRDTQAFDGEHQARLIAELKKIEPAPTNIDFGHDFEPTVEYQVDAETKFLALELAARLNDRIEQAFEELRVKKFYAFQ